MPGPSGEQSSVVSSPGGRQLPALRYRRFGGGYRRQDVETALTEFSLTLRQLDADLAMLRDRNHELERQLSSARNEVESYRAREQELHQTMAAVMRRADEIEEGAHTRAQEILAQAQDEAAQIRSEANRRIEDTSAQYNELLRLKDTLLGAMRVMLGDFDLAISRVARGGSVFPAPAESAQAAPVSTPTEPAVEQPPTPAAETAAPVRPPTEPLPEPRAETWAAPVRDPVSIPSTPAPEVDAQPPVSMPSPAVASPPAAEAPADQQPAADQSVAAAPGDDQVFETRVELDVGPFADFAAVSAFERALAHLPKVEDVYVRRLAADRALIELNLTEVAPLLRTMHEALPYELDVKSASRSRIVMDVAVQAPAGAR